MAELEGLGEGRQVKYFQGTNSSQNRGRTRSLSPAGPAAAVTRSGRAWGGPGMLEACPLWPDRCVPTPGGGSNASLSPCACSVLRAQLVPLPWTGVLKYPLPALSPLTCSSSPSTLVSLATFSPPQILCTRTGPVPLDGYPFISHVGCWERCLQLIKIVYQPANGPEPAVR